MRDVARVVGTAHWAFISLQEQELDALLDAIIDGADSCSDSSPAEEQVDCERATLDERRKEPEPEPELVLVCVNFLAQFAVSCWLSGNVLILSCGVGFVVQARAVGGVRVALGVV